MCVNISGQLTDLLMISYGRSLARTCVYISDALLVFKALICFGHCLARTCVYISDALLVFKVLICLPYSLSMPY